MINSKCAVVLEKRVAVHGRGEAAFARQVKSDGFCSCSNSWTSFWVDALACLPARARSVRVLCVDTTLQADVLRARLSAGGDHVGALEGRLSLLRAARDRATRSLTALSVRIIN